MYRIPYNPYHDWLVLAGHDAFAKLFNTELYFMAKINSKKLVPKLLRRSAVEFIENQSRSENFDALIPYMAMTFFDRFIWSGEIPDVVEPDVANINLFLTCCLTIAWKLRTETFVLSSFLNERNLQYSAQNVLDMELHICKHLDWRMRTVTPFCFVEFFIPVLHIPFELPSPFRSVRQLTVKSQFDIAFTEYRPSVLAAAAVITVTSKMFPARFDSSPIENHIFASGFMNPLQDMVYKCKKMLAPLYKDPRAASGEASSSVGTRRSDPIPIPVPGRRTPTPAVTTIWATVMSEGLWLAALPPGTNVEEERILFAQDWEVERIRFTRDRERFHGAEVIQADFDFELGWIEAQADTDKILVNPAGRHAGFCAYLLQGLTGCSGNFMQGCSIL